MKKTIIYALGAAVMLSSLGLAQAQDSKPAAPAAPAGERPVRARGQAGAPGGIEQRVKSMNEQLTLNQEQQDKLKKLFTDQAAKTRDLRQDTSLTPEQRREKTTKLRTENQKMLKDSKILTDEQFTKWEKFQEEQRARGQQNRPAGAGGNRGNRSGGGAGAPPTPSK